MLTLTPAIWTLLHLEIQPVAPGTLPLMLSTQQPTRISVIWLWLTSLAITLSRLQEVTSIYLSWLIPIAIINAVPIKSRSSPELLQGFITCHDYLKKIRFHAKLLCLDKEIYKELIEHIEIKALTYQLASAGDHRNNPAEWAIETFKNHFNAIISGTDPDFPHTVETSWYLRRSLSWI